MRRPPIPEPGRAILLTFLYVVLGVVGLFLGFFGGFPWTGILTFLVITWMFQVHVSRRPWGEVGLPIWPRAPVDLALGLLFGFVLFSLVTLVLGVTGAVRFRPLARPEIPAEILIILVVVALLEELFFRGYPLALLSRAFRPLPALLVTSLVFAFVHLFNPGAGLLPFLGVFLAGCVMAAVRLRWGSLWAAWGLHFAWNAAQGIVYGFRISGVTEADLPVPSLLDARVQGPFWWTGGAFGPEGGLPALLILGGAAWLLVRLPGAPSLEEIQDRREAEMLPEFPPHPVESSEREEQASSREGASEGEVGS
ncbi:MAG: CPBP family intramembrane metalloprotease [Armatimonadetes bacterium]|nr:CPBP family intramembrane metalloprotease [Armatimonadota bacterium]